MLTEGESCDPVSKRLHHMKRGIRQKRRGVGQERFEFVGSVLSDSPTSLPRQWQSPRRIDEPVLHSNRNMLTDFSKILLYDLHLSNNGIYCSIINIGDVNSY